MPDNKEKKTDVVLDENGNALDKDGNKKQLSADYMSRADVEAIIAEFSQHFNEAIVALDKLEASAGYSDADNAFKKLVAVISGGPHIEFAKKNAWIANAAQRSAYLTSGIDQGIADKQFIIDFYKLVVSTQDLRAGFTKLLTSCTSDCLFFAYWAFCYEKKMKEIASAEKLGEIRSAFLEFDSVYNTYNNGNIIASIPMSKSKYSDYENFMIVLDHLNTAIAKKSHLHALMKDAQNYAAAELNKYYIIDKETWNFSLFADKEGSIQQAIATCSELNDVVISKEVIVGDGLWDYLAGYRKLLEKLYTVLQKGVQVIENFKTEKDKAPYAVMHYDVYVKDVVSKHMLGTLSDPLTTGTNYKTMAMKMRDRFSELARTVSKYAPD